MIGGYENLSGVSLGKNKNFWYNDGLVIWVEIFDVNNKNSFE